MNEQFLSRNQNEIMKVFLSYRELLEVHPSYVMYMDKDSWELFDPNFGVVLFRHNFKHLKAMTEQLIELKRDIINVGCIKYREHVGKSPSSSETWSLKRLSKIYNEQQIKYFKYGKIY